MSKLEFVLMDRNGLPREDFTSRGAAIRELTRLRREDRDSVAGWMLLVFNKAGEQLGEPEWAEDLLAERSGALRFVVVGEGRGVFMSAPQAGLSGRAAPTRRGFRRPPSDAIGTRALPGAETVAAQ